MAEIKNAENAYAEKNITLKHQIIFWSIYFLINFFRWGNFFGDYVYSLKTNLIGFPIHMALSYFNILVLMPLFVYRRRYLSYVFFLFTAIFLMVLVKFYLTYYLVDNEVWPEGPFTIQKPTFNYVVNMMIGELYVITFVTAIKITLDWLKEHRHVADLEKSQLETELMFLRNQISPHFFFNTLNNIYGLALEKSDKTQLAVLKLSDLMRYLLYQTKGKRQSLEKEILCMENYLDLERLRYGDQLQVDVSISGNIKKVKIPPMLLLPFIENAFKHGAEKNIGNIKISIDFKIENDFLYFNIVNPMPKYLNKEEEIFRFIRVFLPKQMVIGIQF